MILENVNEDLSVIKQVMVLQNMKTAELEATWSKYFDHPPEVVMSLNRLAERRKDVSKADLMTAIKNLNDVWNFLYQAEQRKIIHMLINKIVIQENGIKIDLNLEDFESLIMQLV